MEFGQCQQPLHHAVAWLPYVSASPHMTASLLICTRSTLMPADVFLCNFLTDSPVKDEWRVLLQVRGQRLPQSACHVQPLVVCNLVVCHWRSCSLSVTPAGC